MTKTTLTPTQLRNARKRRSNKQNKQQQQQQQQQQQKRGSTTAHNTGQQVEQQRNQQQDSIGGSSKRKRIPTANETLTTNSTGTSSKKRQRHATNNRSCSTVDPSQLYSNHPLQAPIIQRAQAFFQDIYIQTSSGSSSSSSLSTTHDDMDSERSNNNKKKKKQDRIFPIFIGPIYGWRTVVKLPVRYTTTTTTSSTDKHSGTQLLQQQQQQQQQQLITIGLFVPKSHTILPIVVQQSPNEKKKNQTMGNQQNNNSNNNNYDYCITKTHHPSINDAIIVIQTIARSLQLQQQSHHDSDNRNGYGGLATTTTEFLTAFSEETGTGYLRYVSLSLQRHTNRIQLVIIWNDTPTIKSTTPKNHTSNNIKTQQEQQRNLKNRSSKILQDFVNALVTIKEVEDNNNNSSWKWHSIWVHYNSTWKHSNAIYDYNNSSTNNNISNVSDDSDNPNLLWELLYHHQRDKSAISGSNLDNTTCPIGGITEYLSITTSKGENSGNNAVFVVPNIHIPLHFPPHVFRQGNITAFTKIVQHIRSHVISTYYPCINMKPTALPNTLKNLRSVTNLCCLELYGGVGTIGLHLIDLVSTYICSDENPYNSRCFYASVSNILQQQQELQQQQLQQQESSHYERDLSSTKTSATTTTTTTNVRYESVSASVMVLDRKEHLQNEVDIIIVDPPRKGMGPEVCSALLQDNRRTNSKQQQQQQQQRDQFRKQLSIYVSCGFDAFVRDYAILTGGNSSSKCGEDVGTEQYRLQQPKQDKTTTRINNNNSNRNVKDDKVSTTTTTVWKLVHAEGHVLFPGSDAIETLAIFTR